MTVHTEVVAIESVVSRFMSPTVCLNIIIIKFGVLGNGYCYDSEPSIEKVCSESYHILKA